MRAALLSTLLAATCAGIAPAAWSTPLLTMHYQIDSLSQGLEFMGDGSVRVITACNGAAAVACDGSVVPAPVAGASFRTAGDGSVRDLTSLLLLGDGSVRPGSELPADVDGILLSALTFSPNPLMALNVSATDGGAPTTFVITLAGPLALGGNLFDYVLSGSALLTDGSGDGVSATEQSVFGLDGLIFAAVDSVSVAALGAGGVSGAGAHPFAPATGSGSCVACALQIVAIGFGGSGGGDVIGFSAQFDLQKAAAEVSEPGSTGLVALGLVAFYARRQRKPGTAPQSA